MNGLEGLKAGQKRIGRVYVDRVRSYGGVIEFGGGADEVAGAGGIDDDEADNRVSISDGREDDPADGGSFGSHLRGDGARGADRKDVHVELRVCDRTGEDNFSGRLLYEYAFDEAVDRVRDQNLGFGGSDCKRAGTQELRGNWALKLVEQVREFGETVREEDGFGSGHSWEGGMSDGDLSSGALPRS